MGATKLFIHCGLHKTGSTALQAALIEMAPALKKRGVLYPSFDADDPFAHHWLAGALKGPHVYKAAQDKIAKMVGVIKDAAPEVVCFSSEDFETHLMHSKAMGRLMEVAEQIDATPVFLIYLRNQVEYLESLYLQFLRQGLNMDASEMINQVIETGQFKWRKWTIQFDYAAMLGSVSGLGGEVIVRNYHALENDCSITDFLTSIDQPVDLKPKEGTSRANAARLKRNVLRFANNRESAVSPKVISDVDGQLAGMRPRLSGQACVRLRERFWEGNEQVAERYGVDVNPTFDRTPSSTPVPVIDQIFETGALQVLSDVAASGQTSAIQLPDAWLAKV